MPLDRPHPPHIYGTQELDRAVGLRKDKDWLRARLADPASRLVAVSGLKVRVLDAEERPHAAFVPPSAVTDLVDPAFLGLDAEGRAVFSADVPEDADLPGELLELRQVGTRMPSTEAGILAYARGLSHWHDRHRFCGRCGSRTDTAQAGHVRVCPECGLQHFPRTDPAIIVLVRKGDRALLGRSPRFAPGMYSTLAGFVEPGESLESAVAREVFEETGVVVEDALYRSSQPWPFPSSLMLGFHAIAVTEDITIEQDELEDARWFTRDEMRHPQEGGLRLPGVDSIARALIEDFLADG
ncbi:NAD(+) diphosphatase [Marinivivus vitaminiproducens]|uniref:NAD(+) diphosphatase n=1 Tax=Marinivivus vitaminiproducens TaxID=3035935 RepID=UPI0027A73980|nr:NAD(+) diphosphatase [Geminicoccaceae bacterium SCSIO 64248]